MKYIFVFLLVFTTSLSSAQQNAPSKQETINYINSWFQNNIVGGRFEYDWITSSASFDGKQIVFEKVRKLDGINYTSYTTYKNINWALCTPTNGAYVTNINSFLEFSTKHLSYYNKTGVHAAQEYMSDYIDLPRLIPTSVTEEELAKLEKAITHLIKLSQEENKNSYFDN